MGELIGLLIFGAIIGALARLVMPGRQSIGILWTIVLGVLGALAGYFLAGLLGVAQTGGIDWIRWVISVIVAVILISIYIGAAGRRKV
jgi:uncharacterized membrane protein YeaQ/YmgE (transglycosylase-associated protein family)